MRAFAEWVENKQVVVGCRWTEERIQIDDDVGRKRCGAGGMKDGHPGIIVHDQGVLPKRFGTVRAAFRETLNPCPKTLFIVEDKHDGLPLSFDLSPTHVVGDVAQKSIPVLPSLIARLGGWFSRNERVPKYVPPS